MKPRDLLITGVVALAVIVLAVVADQQGASVESRRIAAER